MPNNLIEGIAPLYFGLPDSLFGCYHHPAIGRKRRCAVVICQPMGHEYINCHRALRQLAVRLCQSGFPTLRFDYRGCGDSSGNPEQSGLAQWLEDISLAISEVKERAGVAQVCAIGLRLGGSLSLIAGARRSDLDSIVVWDPVVDGNEYLRGLLLLQKEMLRFRPKTRPAPKTATHIDVLGFPLTRSLYAELEMLNLLAIAEKPAKNILVIASDPASNLECGSIKNHKEGNDLGLKDHLLRAGACVRGLRMNAPRIWLPTENGSLLVPNQLIQSIVSWVCDTHV